VGFEQPRPYQDEYLSGFVAESYQIDLPQGSRSPRRSWPSASQRSSAWTSAATTSGSRRWTRATPNVTFKHTLLPVWISAYRFHDRTFRFLVNARTGEVQGERPYSWIKITLFVLMILAIVAIIALATQGR
jgi:hypothetical protein